MDTSINTTSSLLKADQASIWHPFTQAATTNPAIPIKMAEGAYLHTYDGRKYLDANSSWWVNLHGHSHPAIVKKITQQLNQLAHVMFADLTHQPAIELATLLLKILPGNLSKIFYSDNGSTAVETALKMAFQYHYNKNPKTKKTKVVCFSQSYHGDTFGAMSAAGKNHFNKPFWKYLFEAITIDLPTINKQNHSLNQLNAILKGEDVACFIYEPLILGSAGMLMYPPNELNELINTCKQQGVLTIADEVMTGFGRTKTLFASEQTKETPDIICLSKGLTGGFLPLGATACNAKIYAAFFSDKIEHALLHGHSYTGNPLACSSAIASLELLLKPECFQQRKLISEAHHAFVEQWKDHPSLKRCESEGTILAIEYKTAQTSYFDSLRDKLYHHFLNEHILVRPLGNTLYILPPYCITNTELKHIYATIIKTLDSTW